MNGTPSAVFLINLLQDVNVLRPLMFMAARDFRFDTLLLVSSKFAGRDLYGIWRCELDLICRELGCRLETFDTDWEAHRQLTGHGLLFAASESHLHNHVTTHTVFLHAPASYLKVTLQHGFECVGFRHSADHVRAHGATASFGADVICSWYPAEDLASLAASQRAKLLVTGPTSLLQMPAEPPKRAAQPAGIVCENLHSVRLSGAGDLKGEFVTAFSEFCRLIAKSKGRVALRPHPGGQYVLKNNTPLPPNAVIENAPMYRLDLRRFAYGISAPSSVLVDMLLAGIPIAVWRDRQGRMDTDNYQGLATVSTPEEWAQFAKKAVAEPEGYLELQRQFLATSGMVMDPPTIHAQFAGLFQAARRQELRPPGAVQERERILFVASGNVPTLQLSFTKPLQAMIGRGEITSRLLSEPEIRLWADLGEPELESALERYLDAYDPSVVIFCRYSGPGAHAVREWARRSEVPTIYHIDDDLLAVPLDIGKRKFALHNAPERIESVGALLNSVDVVYASTTKLQQRLNQYFPDLAVTAGRIYCSGSAIRRPENRRAKTVGYMASADHAHNLDMVISAIERLLEKNKEIEFELFGSIPIPPALARFDGRVKSAPPVADYARFLEEFAERQWDIGICPLAPISFNLMKANTKWVEYSSAGAAVVASRGTVYDECCSDGCGILADTPDEWFAALDLLVNNDAERVAQVRRAQNKLEREYSVSRLRNQVLQVIEQGHTLVQSHWGRNKEAFVCQTA